MTKDLTTSPKAREKILRNDALVAQLQSSLFSGEHATTLAQDPQGNHVILTSTDVAHILDIDAPALESHITAHTEELLAHGYADSVFTFRAFLALVMLLTDNSHAQRLRSRILDIAIAVITREQGGYAECNDEHTQYPTFDSAPLKGLIERMKTTLENDAVAAFLRQQSEALRKQIQEPETLAVFKRLKDR